MTKVKGFRGIDKLFVYGIFLDQFQRDAFGMFNEQYDTVANYITVGDSIVQAIPIPQEIHASLTGLLVEVAPYIRDEKGELADTWQRLDALEGGYDRIKVKTTGMGAEAWMYVAKRKWGKKQHDSKS